MFVLRLHTILFAVLLAFTLTSSVFGQDLYICKSITESGEPIEAMNEFEIKPWGSLVYILLKTPVKENEDNSYICFIDRKIDGEFEPYDNKSVLIKKGKNWTAINYKFTDEGYYYVYFVDVDQNKLASAYLTVQLGQSFLPKDNQETDSYYNDVVLTFAEAVFSNKPYNLKKFVSIQKDNGDVYLHIKHNKPLKTEILTVTIFKKREGIFEYDSYVDIKKYRLDPAWEDTYIRYKFKNPGDYRFTIYNKEETVIKKGYITVVP